MGKPGRPPKYNLPAEQNSTPLPSASSVEKSSKADIRPYIDHAITLDELPRLSDAEKHDPRAVEERCKLYLDICEKMSMKPSVIGLAVAFRVSRVTIFNARNDGWGKESADVLKHYCNIIDLNLTNLAMDGKVYFAYAEFLQKNSGGYSDKTEVVIDKGDSLLTKDELAKRAEQLPEADEPISATFTDKDEPRAEQTAEHT